MCSSSSLTQFCIHGDLTLLGHFHEWEMKPNFTKWLIWKEYDIPAKQINQQNDWKLFAIWKTSAYTEWQQHWQWKRNSSNLSFYSYCSNWLKRGIFPKFKKCITLSNNRKLMQYVITHCIFPLMFACLKEELERRKDRMKEFFLSAGSIPSNGQKRED